MGCSRAAGHGRERGKVRAGARLRRGKLPTNAEPISFSAHARNSLGTQPAGSTHTRIRSLAPCTSAGPHDRALPPNQTRELRGPAPNGTFSSTPSTLEPVRTALVQPVLLWLRFGIRQASVLHQGFYRK